MNLSTYSSSTVFSMVIVALIIITLLAAALHYLARRRVKRAMTRMTLANDIMKEGIGMSDQLIVALDLKENRFYNIHDERLPETGISYDDVKRLVHPDHRDIYQNFIEGLRYDEKHEDVQTYLFNTNYGPGEPIYHLVTNHGMVEYDREGKPVNIICTMTDETDEEHMRLMNQNMGLRYKDLFEETLVGLSFYNAEGRLIDCNAMMREICNFESRYDSVFYDSSLFDLAQFAVSRDIRDDQSLCSHLELPKRNLDKYVEVKVHPVFDQRGKLKYIALGVRDITEERKLYLQSKQNAHETQMANDDIRKYEEQMHYLLENSLMHVWHSTFEDERVEFMSDLHHPVSSMTIDEFARCIQTDEYENARLRLTQKAEERKSGSIVITRPFKNLVEKDDQVHWYNLFSIPSYDTHGRQTGYFGLIRDVTLLIEEQEMLRRETERANDSDRMKSVFLANMTHEIRTPLNAIVGFSDLLAAIDSGEEKHEMMRIIKQNCDMLLRLINDFLVISTMESNGFTMNLQETDFAHDFDDICQTLSQRVMPPVEFRHENPYSTLLIRMDKERIGQVVTNFVTNAVKYTSQGHITVGYRLEQPEASPQETQLYIYCEDTGTGIPEEDRERIFERFVKLNDYIQGTGLGLSICKAIVERCQGEIGVDSQVGEGSRFWFRIPCDIIEKKEKSTT